MTDPSPANDPAEESPQRKPFRIQRKRLGTIRKIDEKGEFGFIDAEDYRDDVFFHRTVWQTEANSNAGVETRGVETLSQDLLETFVEFELDDEVFASDRKLRAKVVRPTKRPEGKKLSGRDATFQIITHHPNARRKKPKWRS